MDFFRIAEGSKKKGEVDIYADFIVGRPKDLMIRGKSFYAIWDEKACLWSTDEYRVAQLVDEELWDYYKKIGSRGDDVINLRTMASFSSNTWLQFRNFVGHLSDSSIQLDESLTFSNTEVKKEDYVSRRLPYALEPGDISAYKEMFELLYAPEELAKLEWAIGAIISGDAKDIQKFLVLYGEGGTGKSTWLNLVQELFVGYYATFEAKALTGINNSFATEAFKSNPLVAIQHDGDLSKIEDNTKLNSIVSHEYMTMNEKYKPSYMARVNALLLMGTNKPVKITDGKSGLIRRLIDVHPTGKTHNPRTYAALISRMQFELGAIAYHCLETYRAMGKNYYSGYKAVEMMLQTDIFFNFIEAYFDLFKAQDGCTLKQAYELYKTFCGETGIEHVMPQYRFRTELHNYFKEFHDRMDMEDGTRVRSWYSGFIADRFKTQSKKDDHQFSLVMEETESLFDKEFAQRPAQYATATEIPVNKWADVKTKLGGLDTTQLHYVKVPLNHIVIDFDLKDADGNKSAERNLEAASSWPPTYAEFSKGGGGIHLHYNWDGDVDLLSRVYDEGIEVKVFTGDSSLRRRLTRCNSVPVATISTGLPLREKKVLSTETIKSEQALRKLIDRNLRKEIHPGTKPSMDFIHHILDEAYASGMSYDVTDLRGKIMAFANNSSNQAIACLKLMQTMQFKSEDVIDAAPVMPKDERLVPFDVEVFPNLFVICWKYRGSDQVVKMINPTPQQVEELLVLKLVGFNNRRYDNHILYGRILGYNNQELYELSQRIIKNVPGAQFGEAYDLSYADIFDFSSKKQTLKKFGIELGLTHLENEFPWDEPVPEEKWPEVVEYCANDVDLTDAVLEDRMQDFVAREILADLSGLPVNATTQRHTAKIVFGDDKQPQGKFKYTRLDEMFPGYEYDHGTSTYKGEVVGEGGLVRAKPGMYENVALLDVASMHPTSIKLLDLFGEYTENFVQLTDARLAIKRGDFDAAKQMLGGKLARHLNDENEAAALSYALKIVINIVYGLTSASFTNAFRDPRNIDNIVAKRGALFMIELKNFVEEMGYEWVHIKTDSIKIAEADDNIIKLVMDFGQEYGYTFEHEETYDKFCLVNDAVYIAKTRPGRKPAHWVATGAQFAHPYVHKTLFTHEPIKFEDLCETKAVTTALYLDFSVETPMFQSDPDYKPMFVGKVGRFCPITPGKGGGLLVREKDGKFYAATGTKGWLWMEAENVKALGKKKDINLDYFEGLVYDAKQTIGKFGDIEKFVGGE